MSTADYDTVIGTKVVSEQGGPGSAPLKVELRDVTEFLNREGEVVQFRPTARRHTRKVDTNKCADVALLIRRRVDADELPIFQRLEVQSGVIQKAIKLTCADGVWINTRVRSGKPIIVPSPYIGLFFARDEIRKYAKKTEHTAEERTHLQLLLNFMDKRFSSIEQERDRLISAGKITFELFWTLFQPNEPVILKSDYYLECFRLRSLVISNTNSSSQYNLRGLGWDYRNGKFGPVSRSGILYEFEGAIEISRLNIYPQHWHPGGTASRSKLVERGRTWARLQKSSHVYYDGVAWLVPEDKDYITAQDLQLAHVKSRIILDYSTFCEAWPYLGTSFSNAIGRNGDEEEAEEEIEDNASETADADEDPMTAEIAEFFSIRESSDSYVMSDELALLCPAQARGFSLNDKVWALFLVEKVQEIAWREDAIDRLEISSGTKNVVQALLEAHEAEQSTSEPFDDIVPGKGRGLVFLFAGDPGLGKTLTVECFTEKNRRPLYAITSGELGTDTVTTDGKLRRLFKLAKTWGAYLLLDEADVFLAKRSHSDLSRNGLITIFLRQIEYYGGVIFLTTNRLREFDPAFESRIQFKVLYEPLSSTQRTQIWRNLLPSRNYTVSPEVTVDEQSGTEWDDEVLERLGKQYKLNGREIRNMIKNALALAKMQGQGLSESHLDTVAQINQDWIRKVEEIGDQVDAISV